MRSARHKPHGTPPEEGAAPIPLCCIHLKAHPCQLQGNHSPRDVHIHHSSVSHVVFQDGPILHSVLQDAMASTVEESSPLHDPSSTSLHTWGH